MINVREKNGCVYFGEGLAAKSILQMIELTDFVKGGTLPNYR